jgi:4'-phosphopantetheinyl transferase
MAPVSEAMSPLLPGGDVHVWAARLEPNRFAERRAVLRTILSRYEGLDVRRLVIRVAPGGKPEVVQAPDETAIEFNCSSSGELALFAVARGRRVGVDVERVRAVRDPLELVRSLPPEHDRPLLAVLPEKPRQKAFLELWTRTEAYLKACGAGLAGLGEPPADDVTWSIRPLVLGDDYVGAVAAEGLGWRVRFRQW